jgi:hypothetical protein
MRSSSIHNLNADTGLSFIEKLLYLFLNWMNNLFPYTNLDPRLSIRSYGDEEWRKHLSATYESSSVGRRLSDIFWRTLPWDKIQEELGEIHIFDTGCGHGNYSERLQNASGGRIASYTGVDAKRRPSWDELEEKYSNFNFLESRSSDITPLIPEKANLFVTQSAIEHFDGDLRFFEQIRGHVEKSGKPTIQIHNCPGKAILPLYLFHGIRQYTPRTISKITRLFKDSHIYLYGLGGRYGKKVQWKYFTLPQLILRRQAAWKKDIHKYDADVQKAIEADIRNPSDSPIFWVLIIHSYHKKKIW